MFRILKILPILSQTILYRILHQENLNILKLGADHFFIFLTYKRNVQVKYKQVQTIYTLHLIN